MASLEQNVWLRTRARFAIFPVALVLWAMGWRPLWFAFRPGWNIAWWPKAVWYGFLRPKLIKIEPVEPSNDTTVAQFTKFDEDMKAARVIADKRTKQIEQNYHGK